MKDTACENCIFAKPVSDLCACEMGIIDKIRPYKDISVVNGYYHIKNYLCRHGFSKKTYDANIDNMSGINIKQLLLDRLELRYYLIVDCRETSKQNPEKTIETINKATCIPNYISFIVNNDIEAKLYIEHIEKNTDRRYGYKIHCLLEAGDIGHTLPLLLETNLRKNNSQYFWIQKEENLQDIDIHIESIKDIAHIYQPDCDFITQKSYRISDIYGLFLPCEYYIFIKDKYGSLVEAVNSKENLRIVYYD